MVRFVRDKVPSYGPLLRSDLHVFREEIIKATVGAGIAGVCGLIFACFLSVAVVVTAWDSGHRIAAAWVVCGAWAVLAAAGLGYARKATAGGPPFQLTSAALGRDYTSLSALIDTE